MDQGMSAASGPEALELSATFVQKSPQLSTANDHGFILFPFDNDVTVSYK
jgi:hypothetical protein